MSVIIDPGVLAVPKLEPAHCVYLDFETYWDDKYNLERYTTSDYVLDDKFEVLGVGIKIDDGETMWVEEAEFSEWAATWNWSETALCAHHAHFDGLICAARYGIKPAFWFDTLSMSRGLGLPGSLAVLGPHYGIGEKGDELLSSKGKHRKDFTEQAFAEFGLYCIQDVDLMQGIFAAMAATFPESEFWIIDMTIRLFTQPQLVVDEPQLREFVEYEKARKAELLERVGLTKKQVGSNKALAAAFEKLGVEVPMKLSPSSKKRNPDGSKIEVCAFAKTDAGMQALLEHEDEDVRALAEARIAIKSGQSETRGERYLRMGADGAPLPVYLKYCGAHTTRWTASDKTQFQNLEKVSKTNPKKGMLKKSLCAIQGKKIVAADSGAIEARMTAWLAGHTELLEGFRQKRDVYSDFASIAYGRPIDRKKNPQDEIPGFLGKICVLGLGFQLGWAGLAATLLKGAMGGPPVTLTETDAQTLNVDLDKFFSDEVKVRKITKMITRLSLENLAIHCACAEKLVQTYRKANKPITQLWKQMGTVLDVMLEIGEGEQISFGPNDCLTIIRNGIILPTGLVLHYPELRKSKRVNEDGEEIWGHNYSYQGKYVRQRCYSGLMTENVVQALARAVVGEQLVSVRAKYGYEPVLLTHDELVTIVDDAEASVAEHRLVEEMKVPPKWARGLPLTAEGGYAQNYGEA